MKRTLFVAMIALAAACGGKKTESKDKVEPPPATKPMAGSSAPAAMAGSAAPAMAGSAAPSMAGSAAPAAMAGSAEELPAVADYEDKAKTDITDKNAASQLDDLEKDLGQ